MSEYEGWTFISVVGPRLYLAGTLVAYLQSLGFQVEEFGAQTIGIAPEEVAPRNPVYFDSPVGTPQERAERKVWPGYWKDATGYATAYWMGYHTGADLNLNTPTWDADRLAPFYACADGVVTCNQVLSGTWGRVLVIQHTLEHHGQAVYSRYAHINDASVSEGQSVTRGQVLGRIGRPPPAGAYHLHFDISTTEVLKGSPGDWPGRDLARVKRDYVDPKAFISGRLPPGK